MEEPPDATASAGAAGPPAGAQPATVGAAEPAPNPPPTDATVPDQGSAAPTLEQSKKNKKTRLRSREMCDGDDDSSDDFASSEGGSQAEEAVETSPKGRFERFNKKLGSGGMKNVYLGYDTDTGKEIAWSVIQVADIGQNAKKRISGEIEMLQTLKHPRIIAFINAWVNKKENEVCFIFEHMSGGSLANYIRRISKPLKYKVIGRWSRQIVEGLVFLHTRTPEPVIHRDLKCDNIFVNAGEVVIGDLGLSTMLKTSHARSIVGTPDFIAPEIFEENYSTPVDIYAFGMCLLEMADKGMKSPYGGQTAAQVMKKVMNREPPDMLKRFKEKDKELKESIMRCIAWEPSRRPTAQQLMEQQWFNPEEDGDSFCELIPEDQMPPEKAPAEVDPLKNDPPRKPQHEDEELAWERQLVKGLQVAQERVKQAEAAAKEASDRLKKANASLAKEQERLDSAEKAALQAAAEAKKAREASRKTEEDCMTEEAAQQDEPEW